MVPLERLAVTGPIRAAIAPHCVAIGRRGDYRTSMTDREETFAKVAALIAPLNKKGVEITENTRFAQDLEWDSLTVLDFVANIEDEFDLIITMNMQAEIETVGQLVDAVARLQEQM
jgi:acyl carrier protein